jgi:hypothetical protein
MKCSPIKSEETTMLEPSEQLEAFAKAENTSCSRLMVVTF